ncbi:MAG: hypothetical protein ACWA5Q_07430 [bacterium]
MPVRPKRQLLLVLLAFSLPWAGGSFAEDNVLVIVLFLDDLTERDIERWLGEVLAREEEQTFEYNFIWKPIKPWRLLAGGQI